MDFLSNVLAHLLTKRYEVLTLTIWEHKFSECGILYLMAKTILELMLTMVQPSIYGISYGAPVTGL